MTLQYRKPTKEDGAGIWQLVRDTGVLDVNSAYSYIMLGEFFSDTCVVAERDGQVVGFVSAFLPPNQDDTLFVWQIAVDGAQRGQGIGSSLLEQLLSRGMTAHVRYVEATISPSNAASQALFRKLAARLNCELKQTEGFSARLFPGGGHEDEPSFRVGPFYK